VIGDRIHQLGELSLEPGRLERGHVVRPDADGEDVGLELREGRQLRVDRHPDGGSRDGEVDDAHSLVGVGAQGLRDEAHVAMGGPAGADALRRRVADRDVEQVSGLGLALPPELGVDGDALGQLDPPARLAAAEVLRPRRDADRGERDGDEGHPGAHPSTVLR
jgi:hypothetical protein